MKEKVLLLFCPTSDRRTSINVLPPLGILSIASYCEQRGIQVDVLDLQVESIASLDIEKYNIIGFSVNISNFKTTLDTIAGIKKSRPHLQLVVGGPLCMSNPEYFAKNPMIDAVFTGEGEEAFFEYLTSDRKEDVKGIWLRKDSRSFYTGSREWIKNLDALPFPAFQKINIKRYNCFPKKRWPVSSIMTSRGCPYNCIFCSHAMGKQWRARSVQNVVEELKWQQSEFGIKEICVYDDNFSLSKKRAEGILNSLISEKISLSFQFSNGLRVDNLDTDLLGKLKEAGTWLIGIAPESGSPEVMKKIKKGFDHARVLDVRAECRRLGIATFGFFMIGFPFETRKDIEDTIAFAKRLDCEIVEFNKVVPYSGTELFAMLAEMGCLLEDTLTTEGYHGGSIATHKVGDLNPQEVKSLIRKAYRGYYLRLSKIVQLLRTFSWKDLLTLTRYALQTGSV